MDKKDLELIFDYIKNQTAINHRNERLLSDLTMGANANPQIKDLRELIRQNQSIFSELEKKIKLSEE